jgi:hypothetical protein
MAEDLNAFFPNGNYHDILTFEADIAQLSDLVLLFSESFGSAAELWPAPGSEDTELGVLMGPEGGHGETKVHAGVQA